MLGTTFGIGRQPSFLTILPKMVIPSFDSSGVTMATARLTFWECFEVSPSKRAGASVTSRPCELNFTNSTLYTQRLSKRSLFRQARKLLTGLPHQIQRGLPLSLMPSFQKSTLVCTVRWTIGG